MQRLLNLIFGLFFVFSAFGQNCAISSDTSVCADELLSFSISSSKTVSAADWNFGDGTSSTQLAVAHSYSQYGQKTVSVDVTFSDGTTCKTSKQIMVHDLPTADFTVNNSKQCIFRQNLCLTDNSSMGATTNGYDQRLAIWGDGNITQSQTPSNGDVVCYTSYPSIGQYKISVEVRNDKGCEDKWQQDVEVLQDFRTSWRYVLGPPGCDERTVNFWSDSAFDGTLIGSFEWDFGDGSKNSTDWTSLSHTYTNEGTYLITFTVTLKNGCTSKMTRSVKIRYNSITLDVDQQDSVLCYPRSFKFLNPSNPGVLMFWELRDSAKELIGIASYTNNATIEPPYPGDFYVRLIARVGNCRDSAGYFKISSVGVKADFLALNRYQCGLRDTVFFHNQSVKHPDARPEYVWSFDDENAALCSTWVNNCNYDKGYHSRHWYSDTGCYYPKLYAFDPVSGCKDSMEALVTLQLASDSMFTYQLTRPCIGNKTEYVVKFDHYLCEGEVEACYDSSKGEWTNFSKLHVYDTLYEDDGWVTPGFRVELGDEKVYHSADLDDFTLEEDRICIDTFWLNDWFHLNTEPELEFEISRDSCRPVNIRLRYTGKDSLGQEVITVDWQDDFEYIFLRGKSVPDLEHVYHKDGVYNLQIRMIDTFGCYSYYLHNPEVGIYRTLLFDSLVCLGETVDFKETVNYFGSSTNYWLDPDRPEEIRWDYGQGQGVSDTGKGKSLYYDERGTYQIKMITEDSVGCIDTLVRNLHVGGVEVRAIADSVYNCNEIIRFFDSSYLEFGGDGDSIVRYWWSFGDGSIGSILKDPYHNFNSNGKHVITHVVETANECTDTLVFSIYLDGPQPAFDITTDSIGCAPWTVTFTSKSTNVSEFIWHFGDPLRSTRTEFSDTSVTFTYDDPGIYHVYLEGADSFYNPNTGSYYSCKSVFPDSNAIEPVYKRVIVLGYPEVNIDMSQPHCIGQDITVLSNSDTIYKQFQWRLDGVDLPEDSNRLTLNFQDTGQHVLALLPTYVPVGKYQRECFDSAEVVFRVSDLVAGFTVEQISNCNEYRFTDSSRNAMSYLWDFGHPADPDESKGPIVSHDYGLDSGLYTVCLQVESPEGCRDTACLPVDAKYYEQLILYNVFTPGQDGYNDSYLLDVFNTDLFVLEIYNRWGDIVFQTKDPKEAWDGTQMQTGQELPDGTYFYVLTYSFDCTDEEFKVNGSIELLR